MKKRNAKVFALFMSVAMAMPNVAAAMPVYAAPEVEEAAEEVEEVEEVEFDDTDVEEEAAAEDADVDSPVGTYYGDGYCGVAGKEESVYWELEDGKLVLSAKEIAQMKDYASPEETPWADFADKITEIKVTGLLENIGDNAFRGCKNLTTVELNNDIHWIGESSFEGCSALTKVSYPSNEQAHARIYGPYAFKDCEKLESISFTKDLVEIREFCFYNCKSLAFENGLNFQSNLRVIGKAAFWGCISLNKLILPDSVKRIEGGFVGDEATAKRLGLSKWYDSADACSSYNSIDGKLGAFTGCTGLSSIEFNDNNEEGIDYIGEFAFYGCKGLGDVRLPYTLGKIGSSFLRDGDGNLVINPATKDVVLDVADQLSVDKYAFEDCTGIATVLVEDSDVAELYGTFKRCEGIKSVTIGTYDEINDWYDTGIKVINKETFQNCTSLTTFIWDGTKSLLNDNVIGTSAFYGCKSLQNVKLSDALLTIEDRAFERCVSLKTIDIPEGTETIGKNAFFEDILLDDIFLPVSLKKIGTSAFSCNNADLETMHLMDVYYSGTEGQWEAFLPLIEGDNDLLKLSGKNYNYKANKYFDSVIDLDIPTIKSVEYKKGGVEISWNKVSYTDAAEKTYSPVTYYIYQNHITDKKVDDQWEQQTPLWTIVGSVSGSQDTYVYKISDTMKAGDVYSFRIRAEYNKGVQGETKLSPYYTYSIPAEESDLVAVEGLSFIQDTYSVDIDQKIDVAAVITPENASPVAYGWESANPEIAVVTVSEDKKSVTVTGKKEGHTTVTVTTPDGGKTASFEVYVTNPADKKVESIKFDSEKVTVAEGQPVKVSITVTPADAKASFEWESDNTKYATVKVADDEKSAIITGVKEGTTEITVTANNGVTATIKVEITKKAEGEDTISNTFDKNAAENGVAVDAAHTLTLTTDEKGNFTGAEITGLDGKVDESVDSYIANIVTKRDADGNPVEFYSLIFTDGKWDTSYDSSKNGAYQFKGESYMVAGGVINQNANGLQYCGEKEGFKFLAAGKVVTDHAGLVEYDGEWFWIDDKGSVDITYAAIVEWKGSNFLVRDGQLRTDFTGFTNDPQNETVWYHITLGQVWGDGEITDVSVAGGTMTRMVLNGKVVQ